MKRFLRSTQDLLLMLGLDFRKMISFAIGLPYFLRDFQKLRNQKKFTVKEFPLGRLYPCMGEKSLEGSSLKGHYFHQDLLVARRIYLNNPRLHVDVGSRVDGFVAHVASFRSIEVFDIRPVNKNIVNISFVQADLMAPVSDKLVNYCDSLSCLHALEHFGLGRYGDPVNYDGYLLGLNNFHRILTKGGKFYLSVPIGPQRIEFNAHRVFSLSFMLECFAGKYHIDQFSFVDDQGDLHENIAVGDINVQNNFGCLYGCGIFEMTKL